MFGEYTPSENDPARLYSSQERAVKRSDSSETIDLTRKVTVRPPPAPGPLLFLGSWIPLPPSKKSAILSLEQHMLLTRRQFISSAAVTGATAASRPVSIVIGPDAGAPAQWAAGQLAEALTARGVAVKMGEAPGALRIVCTIGNPAPNAPEALAIIPGKSGLLACGHDTRGLVYALLELADRVQNAADPIAALGIPKPVTERPANKVRSVTRLFCSDIEDKPWFNDREMWPRYLTMLAAQRFNRFNLSFGIGYDFITNVTDAYFLFTYPFLLAVPGYNVRAANLPDAERDRNLEMLKFISEQTVARGMEFQLGLWMHGYKWIDSPNPNYTIEGLTPETHGPYCRDAVRALLQACPAISGVTFRVHGESGVEEGSYAFWKTVFEGVATCGRKVEIDMHAKGMDQTMIDMAVATGLPVKISPKYWAEHMGMPYMQTEIRELERPKPGREAKGLMKFSAGSRSFLRYGYGDLMREDRRWGVLHRIWPGTQRLLVWGDPLTAAAHSRAFQFCGSDGVEIMEPLSFKGRRGSGLAGNRTAYAGKSLAPRWDWEKYVYSHRVWGRLLYNPECDPDVWRRYLRHEFGPKAQGLETALANASRILPIVTTAHGASAGNNTYWPEVYLNQSMVDAVHFQPYTDTPAPRVFGNVSPLDPRIFARINDFADELLAGGRGGKYSPVEVAQWIEDYASAAMKALPRAAANDSAAFRRIAIDVSIQSGLGRFFGAKFRAGLLYRIHEKTGDRTALAKAVEAYRTARAAWVELANIGKVYVSDITVGERPQLRGHWLDRLPAIDQDIAAMAKMLSQAKPGEPPIHVALAIREAAGRPRRAPVACRHTAPARFTPGKPLAIEVSFQTAPESVRLYYRHVNQAERYQSVEMHAEGNRHLAAIPAEYTDSAYPLAYYFEVGATLYPGFSADLTNQPYFTVRRS